MVMNLHRDTGQVQDFGEEGGATVLLSDLMGLVHSVFGGYAKQEMEMKYFG